MTPQEAASILNISPDISVSDLKKHFRTISKKSHPDVGGDPEEFKKITSAYNDLLDFKENPQKYQTPPFNRVEAYDNSPFPFEINIADIFSNFTGGGFKPNKNANGPPPRTVPPINLTANLSFKECVEGKEYDLDYQREVKCDGCNGIGSINKGNGCKECNGFGHLSSSNGNLHFTRICGHCRGMNQKSEKCVKCNGKSYLEAQTKLTVSIPPGTPDKSILRLQGAGNYSSNSIFGDSYTDALLNIVVSPDPVLKLEGIDVVMNLELTLLEALDGTKKVIPTINGEETIEIKPKSRHNEEVILKGLGVKGKNGNERVIFNVIYPEGKLEQIIQVLKE